MLRCSIWYFIERIKQVQVISLQRDIKVSCKTVDDHASWSSIRSQRVSNLTSEEHEDRLKSGTY